MSGWDEAGEEIEEWLERRQWSGWGGGRGVAGEEVEEWLGRR